MRNLAAFDRLEELMWDGGTNIKPKNLDDDMVLLVGLTDTRAEEICREEVENGLSMFHTLEKWSPSLRGMTLGWFGFFAGESHYTHEIWRTLRRL